MNNNVIARVVRVTSLNGFCNEVSFGQDGDPHIPKPVLRLLNHQVEGQHSAALVLSLQGVNRAGEVVWLCEAHTISWLYGKPFGQAAESIYAGMRDLETTVRVYLETQGYEVRAGDYGLPDSVKPLAASFECAKWVRAGEREMRVEAACQAAETLDPSPADIP
ncbi:hypothetical protein FJY94_04630 [Candidatus Kaiserbacteria bacterium]|nr:hypothetical protein [Candidatus Kaiserbacteria bacterium]